MKIRISILLAIVLLSGLISCKDFLDNEPKHQWEAGKALTTYLKAQQAVNGIYGLIMPGDGLNGELNFYYANMSGLFKRYDNHYFFTHNQSNTPTSVWTTCYNGINACNLAINGIKDMNATSFPTATAQDELIAEARFLRGYLYSKIMLTYCYWWEPDGDSKYGIVYRDKMSETNNVYAPRITVGESWEKILEDIDFGIANMPDAFVTNHKVSKIFAKAYKTKLLIIRGTMHNSAKDIADAKTLIDEVIANIPLGIAMEDDMRELYTKSWDSKENIFVRYLEDNGNRTFNAGFWTRYGLGYDGHTDFLDSANQEVDQTDAICGLEYGLDWFRADPRWFVATGKARKPEPWHNAYAWVWKKIYREGDYAGKTMTPPDEKYATYHMRLPELYLLQAELIARTGGSLDQAIAPINTMRAKRTFPVLDQIAPPATIDDFWDILFQEYVKELFLENGTEYWASLRIPKDGMTYMEVIKQTNSFTLNKTKLQWPLPNSEIINNPNAMQNPGQS